jgi:hypothetical protein
MALVLFNFLQLLELAFKKIVGFHCDSVQQIFGKN